jgi:hypothetical protein
MTIRIKPSDLKAYLKAISYGRYPNLPSAIAIRFHELGETNAYQAIQCTR